MKSLPSALKNSRCILHIDLDCFYCQVEQVRLGIPFHVPAAVQQWHGLIAVNYAARNAGVKKMTNIKEAQMICPNIRLLHVATYAENDTEPHYYKNPDRNTHKVSLDAYRNASRNIFKIFHAHCDKIQKIGLDEAFMDVTTIVNQRLMERYPQQIEEMGEEEWCDVEIAWDTLGNVIESEEEKVKKSEDGHWSRPTWRDLQLAMGAELAAEIRKKVYDELQYFCSAGIAHYKVVAKLCSSKHKPNKQTVLRECARPDFMRDVPFNKIRNMGGKLGTEVGTDLDIVNSSELWSYSVEELQRKFGESTGLYIYNICRGIDNEEVNFTKAPKSLGANKTFTKAIQRKEDMNRWFSILAIELQTRILQNFEEFNTWPRSISIRYATLYNRSYRSKVLGSFSRGDLKTHEILTKKFEKAYNSIEDAYPCIGIDLVASGLSLDESATSHTLNRFFNKSSTSAHDANGHNKEEVPISEKKEEDTKKRSKASFFKNSTRVTSNTVSQEETYKCDACKKPISILEVEEHSDYHFALSLQEEQSAKKPKHHHGKISAFFQSKHV